MSKRINFNITNDNQGNLGIGTTSPNFKLHVIGDIFANGEITSTSDLRLKSNIEPLILSNEKIKKIQELRGVQFTRLDQQNKNQMHIGFIAQELEEIIPEVVYTDPQTGYKSIAYGNMSAFLFEYIKHLQSNIDELKKRIDNLENKN